MSDVKGTNTGFCSENCGKINIQTQTVIINIDCCCCPWLCGRDGEKKLVKEE